jgi:hypothetical protein
MVVTGVKNWFIASSYPLFNIQDEIHHYDLLCHISEGKFPKPGPAPMLLNTTLETILYSSPEYLTDPPPTANIPNAKRIAHQYTQILPQLKWKAEQLRKNQDRVNLEIGSPPLYYSLGALWRLLGKSLSLDRINLIYWQRGFNVLLSMLFVWLAVRLSQRFFERKSTPPLANRWLLPVMAAVFPADYFSYITPDALTAVAGGLALVSLVVPFGSSFKLSLVVACSVCFLLPFARLSTIVWLIVLPLLALLTWPDKALRHRLLAGTASLALGFIVLVSSNLFRYGEPWGLNYKQTILTWTEKPFSLWLTHPLFSFEGAWTFLSKTIATFWRGDIYWKGVPLPTGVLDYILIALTLFVLLATPFWIYQKIRRQQTLCVLNTTNTLEQDRALLCLVSAGWLLVIGGLSFLALLSIRFDFGQCFFPSQDFPYFATGRLLSMGLMGFLVTFIVLFNRMLAKLGRFKNVFWFALIFACVAFQLYLAWLPLQSPFNWFHLRGL